MIKHKIFLVGLLALIIGFTSCSDDKKDFQFDVPEAFEFAQNVEYVKLEKLVDIILSHDTVNYIFVDVREPHDYIKGHIVDAINLPLKSLHGENIKTFCEQNVIYLIYGYDGSQAALVYTHLRQLGIKNVAPLGGGYGYIYNNIINSFNVKSATYDDEDAKYNYAKIIAETSGLNVPDSSSNSASAPPPVINVQNTDNNQSSGGCD